MLCFFFIWDRVGSKNPRKRTWGKNPLDISSSVEFSELCKKDIQLYNRLPLRLKSCIIVIALAEWQYGIEVYFAGGLRQLSTLKYNPLADWPKSRQNAWLFLQSSEMGPPHPQAIVPPPPVPGGDTLAGEGVGGPNSDEMTERVVL